MNFFQHQENARKLSRRIYIAFFIVTILMIVAIDALVLIVVGLNSQTSTGINPVLVNGPFSLFSIDNIKANSGVLILAGILTAGTISLASIGKVLSLRGGGSKVARDLGGTLVTADAREPLRRRLYNVVEEISIASGVPVPDVFILEHESAINAFAAGYGVSDAAVAVTQGTLEKLSRSELQGVVAHEFSHILNGDMRINIRLMGVIFGIMVLSLFGRKFLHVNKFQRRSSKNNSAGAIIAIGLALMIIGYLGLFFARWMKSAVSRQREYLADASAVQFTRNPDGISGALKKIAAYNTTSYLKADTEEVSHMLFTSAFSSKLFATHPALQDRIKRIEKGFNAHEIEHLAKKIRDKEQRDHFQASLAEEELLKKSEAKNNKGLLNIDEIIGYIGNPDSTRISAAILLAESLPDSLKQAVHSSEWSPEVLLYSLLDSEPMLRDKQLLIVVQMMGSISEQKIQHIIETNGLVKTEQRLPLLEIAFPSIKRRPHEDLEKFLETLDRLANVDRDVDSFEFLLTRLLRQYLTDSVEPKRGPLHGNRSLKNCIDELTLVISILASHGQNSKSTQGIQLAQRAFKTGMSAVGIEHKNLSFVDNWQAELDKSLTKLNELKVAEKKKVVIALGKTVLDDKKLITEEQEMMRVICALIHVPIPLLQSAA